MSKSVFQLSKIRKSFQEGGKTLPVLKGISFSLEGGEVVSLLGPSGAGKSTLLHIAGLLEKPDTGDVVIEGQKTSTLSDVRRTQIRCQTVGFIYQFHHLLPEFTALENVILPQLIAGISEKEAKATAEELLTQVGLKARVSHLPAQLSGGEQQRVAIARAIANEPKILLADEPTGNLDTKTSERIFNMILDLAHERGMAALIVTHNPDLAAQSDKIMTLENGSLS